MLLRSLLLIKQKQQGRFEVDGRYVIVNVAASAKSVRIIDEWTYFIFNNKMHISFIQYR
jgi:hypothetical protein